MTIPEKISRLLRIRKRTTFARIQRRYLMMEALCIVGVLSMLKLKSDIDITDTLFWYYNFFCLFFAIQSFVMYRRLGLVPEIMSRSLADAQRSLIRIDKARTYAKYLSWATGLPLIVMLYVELYRNALGAEFAGAVVGGIAGAVVGVRWEILTRRQMRALIEAMECDLREGSTAQEPFCDPSGR